MMQVNRKAACPKKIWWDCPEAMKSGLAGLNTMPPFRVNGKGT